MMKEPHTGALIDERPISVIPPGTWILQQPKR
ncbi:hypothetical protein HAP32_03724 [Serratia fonticola]|nr:hypothetical protein HAP32_03724 [Serratia fonticola]